MPTKILSSAASAVGLVVISLIILLLLPTSVAGLVIIILLSLLGALSLCSQLCGRKAQTEIYEDKDGKSTPEASKAFTTNIPRAILLILSIVGLGLSVALAVLATLKQGSAFVPDIWITVGAWVRNAKTPQRLDWRHCNMKRLRDHRVGPPMFAVRIHYLHQGLR